VALAAALLAPSTALAGHGLKALDHPAPSFGSPTPPNPAFQSGGRGAKWELVTSIPTGNPHTDLDFFEQGGNTYASVGTLAIGGNGGGDVRHEASDLRSRLEQLQGEARELIRLITEHGVQLKDPARGLLDFPALVDGDDALLCWEVGEERIAWWHRPEDGYAGRRPLTS
jgi:hypothetical protein